LPIRSLTGSRPFVKFFLLLLSRLRSVESLTRFQ
jgi:hypothetical protein